MGNIGEKPEEIEVIPLEEPMPETEPVIAPAEPVEVPEKEPVPA